MSWNFIFKKKKKKKKEATYLLSTVVYVLVHLVFEITPIIPLMYNEPYTVQKKSFMVFILSIIPAIAWKK